MLYSVLAYQSKIDGEMTPTGRNDLHTNLDVTLASRLVVMAEVNMLELNNFCRYEVLFALPPGIGLPLQYSTYLHK